MREVCLALVMRRDHPLASQASVSWKDGVGAGLIAMAPGTGIRLEIERGLAEIGRSAQPNLVCSSGGVCVGPS